MSISTVQRSVARGVRTFDAAEVLQPNAWAFTWTFVPGDEAFEGHFPHQPILPGVFLVEMAQRAAEYALSEGCGRCYRLRRVKRFRFHSAVLPGQCCRLRVQWPDIVDSEMELSVVFERDGHRLAQGLLVVQACPEAEQ